MYSTEMKELLKLKKYILTSDEYLQIFNINSSPQITSIKYDDNDDTFNVLTSDDYSFKFVVLKKNKV